MDTLHYISNGLSMIALISAVALLFVVVRRDRKNDAIGHKRDDIASMMILLQTMRDLLEQQKGLARELNKALDTRIEFIKQTVESAREELKLVRESAKTIAGDLERLRKDVETVHVPQIATAQAQPANITPIAAYASHQAVDEPPREHERPVLRVLAMPREPETSGDALDSWVGLDFAGDEPDPLGFEVPDTEPEAPQDAEAARDAFRALLDLTPEDAPAHKSYPAANKFEAADKPVAAPNIAPAAVPIAAPAVAAGGNGRPVPPVHRRVYEYNDAGMTVAQIAQELGIGKGEVRLILSLRKDHARE